MSTAWVLGTMSGCAEGPNPPVEDLGETNQDLAGTNLGGLNLAGANLGGLNLGGLNLGGLNLGGNNLGGLNLGGLNLGGLNLAGNNLGALNFAGSNLAGSNLGGLNLAGGNLGGLNLAATSLAGSNIAGAYPGLGCPKAGTSNLGTDLTVSTIATDIHGSVTNSMLYSGEDLYTRTQACIVSGLGSTAMAKLVAQNSTDVTMYAAIRPLSWGFTTTAGGAVELTAWEVVVWGSSRYSVFILAAPPTATHAGVAGFVKAVWRWTAPPTKTLQIGAIGGGQPVVSYPGMMDAGAKVVAGTVTEKAYMAGELALITATTNNVSVMVDFSSWVRKSDNTGLMLANVTTPSGPTYGEAVYIAMEEPDGTIRMSLRGVSAAGIIDGLQQLGTAYTAWQTSGGTKPAPRRCAGALFLHAINNAETDWQTKCDNGTTWAPRTAQTTGFTTWSAVGGTVTPYNTYMTIQGPASTPYVTCRPTDIVGGVCPASSLLPVISETFVHMWEPAYTGVALNTATEMDTGGDWGGRFSCARRTDGTVWCWGSNNNDVVVHGLMEPNSSRQVTALGSTVANVQVGGVHACALKADGTVWCWGANWAGMFGNGNTTSSETPSQTKINATTGLTGVTALDAGRGHTCAIKGGAIWCWGINWYGEIGNNTTTEQDYAVQVGTAKTWTSVATGYHYTCALNSNNKISCWGNNDSGQLGNGNMTEQHAPVQVGTDKDWAAIATSMGDAHTCAIKTTGTLWCWGKNANGQLGIGSTANRTVPTQVGTATNWTEVKIGQAHTCARKTDGTTWCWGANNYGQLGDGTNTQRTSPVPVTGLTTVAVQLASGDNHTCARIGDGSIRCWGQNSYGNLASGSWSFNSPTQQVASLGSSVATVANYGPHACAVKADGTAWCWGENNFGQLGNGTLVESATPVQVRTSSSAFLTGVVETSVGTEHSCARKTDNTVWCWGGGYHGKVGNGSDADVQYAIPVMTGVAQVLVGESHSCARKTDGTVWCWGGGGSGELGNGSGNDQYAPTQVTGLTGVAQIAVRYFSSCARKTDGTAWCWGWNGWGAVGDGTQFDRYAPVQVTSLGTNVTGIVAGMNHACASKTDGSYWCWGQNDFAQLGDGTTTQVRTTPVQMTVAGAGVVDVQLGDRHTCVRKTDGSMWCWGYNNYGELGIGSLTTSLVTMTHVTDAVATVSAGRYRTCAIKTDGALWCWGLNSFGEVGNGMVPHSSVPLTALW